MASLLHYHAYIGHPPVVGAGETKEKALEQLKKEMKRVGFLTEKEIDHLLELAKVEQVDGSQKGNRLRLYCDYCV